jgi:hypothetical protein
MNNKILGAAEAKIESSLTPENRADYNKVVTAGMKLALQKGPNGILGSLAQSKNPIPDAVNGAINLCGLLRKQSRGTMPVKAMVPAAMTLLLHALDFADKTGLVKIGTPELVQATHQFANEMFKRFKITAPMLHTAAAKVHAMTQDPGQMEKINRAAGTVKAPNASSPPPMPMPSSPSGGMIQGGNA